MPLPALALLGIKTGAAILPSLFGPRLPRGDFQRFSAVLYPHLAQQAQVTGVQVEAYWFGDRVRVLPSGQWTVVDAPVNAAEFRKLVAQNPTPTYIFTCDGDLPPTGSPEFADALVSACGFELVGGSALERAVISARQSVGTATETPGSSGLLLAGGLLGGLFLLRRLL